MVISELSTGIFALCQPLLNIKSLDKEVKVAIRDEEVLCTVNRIMRCFLRASSQSLSRPIRKLLFILSNFIPYLFFQSYNSVVDSGFPIQEGANPKRRDTNLLFGQFFLENCIKMKEIDQRGARILAYLLDLK